MFRHGRRRGLYARVQVQTENSLMVVERGRKARGYELTLGTRLKSITQPGVRQDVLRLGGIRFDLFA